MENTLAPTAIEAAVVPGLRAFITAHLEAAIRAALKVAIAELRLWLLLLNLLRLGSDCGIPTTPAASLAIIAALSAIIATLCHFDLRFRADFWNTNAFNLSGALFKNRRCLRALHLNGGSLHLFGALFGTFGSGFLAGGARFIARRLS